MDCDHVKCSTTWESNLISRLLFPALDWESERPHRDVECK